MKNDYIEARVSTEQKELFKCVATEKNISINEFIVVATEKSIEKAK